MSHFSKNANYGSKKPLLKLLVIAYGLICINANGHAIQAQDKRTEISIDFRVNHTEIDPAYSNNAVRMQEIIGFLREVNKDSTINLVEVSFCGAASPEGSYQLNRKLARGRLSALEALVRKEVAIPDSIITRNDSYIPWEYLKSRIMESDMDFKDEIISIIGEEGQLVGYHQPNTHVDKRIVKLKRLDGGRVWQQINRLYFQKMRNACAVFITYKREPVAVEEPQIILAPVVFEPAPAIKDTVFAKDTLIVEKIAVPIMDTLTRRLYIKTNAIGLAMAIANIGIEIDLGKHWSFALPVYYSAWNYLKTTIKFRTFAVQPEFRYWPRKDNDGFFTGAHFGLAYYNFAFNGDYRYQDYNMETPAIGGGISLGYRLPMGKSERWRVEFSLGAGVYPLHYDKFHNTPRTKDGLKIESIKKTYWGIDQAAVSFSYSFDLKKKGEKR